MFVVVDDDRPHRMSCIAEDAGYRGLQRCRSVGVYVCLCVLVAFVSCAKTAEPIQMMFSWLTRVHPRNHILDGVPDPPRGRGTFWGFSIPFGRIGSICYGVCSKRSN